MSDCVGVEYVIHVHIHDLSVRVRACAHPCVYFVCVCLCVRERVCVCECVPHELGLILRTFHREVADSAGNRRQDLGNLRRRQQVHQNRERPDFARLPLVGLRARAHHTYE